MKFELFSRKSLPLPQESKEAKVDTSQQEVDRVQQEIADLPLEKTEASKEITVPVTPKTQYKRRIWLYSILGLGAIAIGGIFSQQMRDTPQETTNAIAETAKLPVRVAQAKVTPLQQFIFGDGYVSAVRGKHLSFENSGTITYLKKVNGRDLREGDFVKAGELLAKVDDRRLRADLVQAQAKTAEAETQRVTAQSGVFQAKAALESAKADVVRAEADLKSARDASRLAKSELRRREQLFAQGVISASDVDVYRNQDKDASAKLEAIQAQLTAARTQVKSAVSQVKSSESQLASTRASIASARAGQMRSRVTLEDTVIQAPFNGVVAHLNIREGDYWTPQRVQITGNYQSVVDSVPIILIDPQSFQVTLRLPAFDGTLVRPGQQAYVVLDKDMSQAATKGMSQETLFRLARARGRVFSVSPSVSPGERAVEVTVRLNEGMKNVRDGERVSVWLAVQDNPTALVVPPNAMVYRDQKPHLFVVDRDKQMVKLRPVEEGIRGISQQEIKSGLKPGELVVIEGRNRLVDGTPVEVMESSN